MIHIPSMEREVLSRYYYYFIFIFSVYISIYIYAFGYSNILCTFSYTRDILFRETNHVDAGETLFMDSRSAHPPPPKTATSFYHRIYSMQINRKKLCTFRPSPAIGPGTKMSPESSSRNPTSYVGAPSSPTPLLISPPVGAVRRMCCVGEGGIDCALRAEIYSSE